MKFHLSVIRTLFLLIISFLTHESKACVCSPLEPINYHNLFDGYDIVVVGTPVDAIHYDNELKSFWNKEKEWSEVKIKIENVLKGNKVSEYIIVNQFGTGNCGRRYSFGESYLIFGNRINAFSEANNQDLSIQDPYPAPCRSELKNGLMVCYSEEKEEIKFWNKISRKEQIIFSNYCISFYTESTLGAALLEFITSL